MLRELSAIFLVIALLAATLLLLRRKGVAQFQFGLSQKKTRANYIQIIDKKQLTPHHSVHLVQVKGGLFLIGVSPSGCQRIARLSKAQFAQELQDFA